MYPYSVCYRIPFDLDDDYGASSHFTCIQNLKSVLVEAVNGGQELFYQSFSCEERSEFYT